MIDTAMVLAAGKGTRMRAAAGDPPKPLVELAGESLLARMLDRLRAACITRIIVNVHHKAGQIEAMLAASRVHPRIRQHAIPRPNRPKRVRRITCASFCWP